MSNKDYTKNDYAWSKLFEKHNILEKIHKNSFFVITSQQINEFREARLMTKFDQKANLPSLFRKHKLSILPISRGSYVIGKFDAYMDVKYDERVNVKEFTLIHDFESLNINNLYSEAAALHAAFLGNLIADILEEEAYPTISGRMSTGKFNFYITSQGDKFNISVNNSQCEIDGGFESKSKLLLLEAKNFEVDNFLIRQLYYPYRLWKNKVQKQVIPAFFTYSNDIFSFFIYEFEDINNYNSLKLIKQKNYIYKQEPITLDDIYKLLNETPVKEEPKVPFPQANNFERVIDLLGLLANDTLSKEAITLNYSFDKRQTDYYVNAGKYLGLIDSKKELDEVICFLTSEGEKVMRMDPRSKRLSLVKKILEHEVFHKCIALYFETLSPLKQQDVISIMNGSSIYNLEKGSSTIERRSSTVLRWIEWILSLTK